MHPMSGAIDDLGAGLRESRGDGVNELFGHECVCATAYDEHRAGVVTDGGCILDPVVPDIGVAGDDVRPSGRADLGEPVELLLVQTR